MDVAGTAGEDAPPHATMLATIPALPPSPTPVQTTPREIIKEVGNYFQRKIPHIPVVA